MAWLRDESLEEESGKIIKGVMVAKNKQRPAAVDVLSQRLDAAALDALVHAIVLYPLGPTYWKAGRARRIHAADDGRADRRCDLDHRKPSRDLVPAHRPPSTRRARERGAPVPPRDRSARIPGPLPPEDRPAFARAPQAHPRFPRATLTPEVLDVIERVATSA